MKELRATNKEAAQALSYHTDAKTAYYDQFEIEKRHLVLPAVDSERRVIFMEKETFFLENYDKDLNMFRGNSKDLDKPDARPSIAYMPIVLSQSVTTVSPDNLPLYFPSDTKTKKD